MNTREPDALSPFVATRASDRLAAAHDASHYLLVPREVVRTPDVPAVRAVFQKAKLAGSSVTFRSGGTSLSGQAGTEALLLDTRRHFRQVEVLDAGKRVRAQPGATIRAVNSRLARFGTRLGPDPASEIACTVGGVVANNSSGMSCGTHANTYRTLDSAVLVLPSGTVVDTGAPDADAKFRQAEPTVYAGLLELRERIRQNRESVSTLHRLHALKNTMGYGLNSFLDFDEPVKILERLVIGSEGTLAFVAEAIFKTVPLRPHAATGLLVFASLADATAALPALTKAGFATIELMDSASLRIAQQDPEAPAELLNIIATEHAALLVELQAESAGALQKQMLSVSDLLAALSLAYPAALTTDERTRAGLWRIRKGLFTAVASARPPGTNALLEDIAVPIDRLGRTCSALSDLFAKHDYVGTVIFGHAKDGNIHFLINERFDDPESLARYEAFTTDLVDLVLSEGGTLKAEHGTGRMMAPFVRRQYGDELYELMWQVKRLIDPDMILNPGVLLTDDPRAHLHHLKTAPAVDAEVDRCVECGYCEPVCPSRDLTLTPRQRIVLRRELQRARDAGDESLVAALEQEYEYDGVQTCAVDGMCQTACPVSIDTGDLVRRLRGENASHMSKAGWNAAARHWDAVTTIGGAALTVAHALPTPLPRTATRLARSVLGADAVPLYSADLPRGGRRRDVYVNAEPAAVYFASCTTTMFGPVGADGVSQSFLRLCERAEVQLVTPSDIGSLCCGTPWKSKGLVAGYEVMKQKVANSLRAVTGNGRLAVVCDASSCTEGLRALLDGDECDIQVVDAVQFVDERVLPRLPAITNKLKSITLHPTCSSTRLAANAALQRLAEAAAEEVSIPDDWGCCGFAGDRGMLHPELTASAIAPEAASVRNTPTQAYASLNRTCELGLTRATGHPYQHVLQVLEQKVDDSDGS